MKEPAPAPPEHRPLSLEAGGPANPSRSSSPTATRGSTGDAGDALSNALVDTYFQSSFDTDADGTGTQMREYRPRIVYFATEVL